MKSSLLTLLGTLTFCLSQSVKVTIPSSPPTTAGQPFPDAFVSYSIEFAYFPDFAGNTSHPNSFSYNLLTNLGDLQGTTPHIRVGGNTQDYALYDASLPIAMNGTINPAKSPDYPTTVRIGPSYFESYGTWPGVKFSHGFNLALAATSTQGWQTLLQTVPLACKALSGGKLYAWEYGNEPDLYSTSAQGAVRPSNWNESTYVSQWLNGTRQIKSLLQQSCPELVSDGSYGYLAPSFAGTGNHLKAPAAWSAGLDKDGDIKLYSTHNYISGAGSPGVTLQGTLMSHASSVNSIKNHVNEYNSILKSSSASSVPPQIFGETNSLYNQGKPGLSNSFGAALWGIDFNLYSASVNIKRVHMHMGTSFRYQSWQPVATSATTMGTKAPYYGNIAVAAFLGNTTAKLPSIVNINTGNDRLVVYASYTDNKIAKLMLINFNAYNSTIGGLGVSPLPSPPARTAAAFTFTAGSVSASSLGVQRLHANGSDAISGITFDGWSYNYELNQGKPVRLANVTVGETVPVTSGTFTVSVPASEAVIVNFPS